VLSLQGVAKEYDFRPILDDVTVALEAGRRYLLTAPNGSGKTTLLQVMCGLSKPTRGSVLWDGKPLIPSSRRHFGVVMQDTFLYGDLTGLENLRFYASIYGCKHPRQVAESWLNKVNLTEAVHLRTRLYSKGMKQRLSLARAMLHEPQILLLDEPFDGMDEASTKVANELLAGVLERNGTLFLVTHQSAGYSDADIRLTLKHGQLVKL
jgi:ABC-type multidrug transport system ATPase subunit